MTVLHQAAFDDLGTPLYDVQFVVLDLETTGGSPAADAITEVGAVKLHRGEVVGEFQTLVNPGRPIPPQITVLTGITHAMVVDAPPIDEVMPALIEFLGDAVFVAHNARFDAGFIRAACQELGYEFRNRTLDTVGLARRVLRNETRNLRLGTLAAHFNSPTQPNHRALEDARATAHVFHALLERVGTMGVTGLDDLLMLPTAKGSPTYEKLSLTDHLPRRPGVYLFRDRDDAVMYVGKAKNLRSRVRSYFYGDTRRSVGTMLRELERIEHIVCATELEAEVTEIRMIHSHRPRHNRRTKPPKASHWVRLTDEAFPRLSIARSHRPDEELALGPFRHRRSAERVVHALWDALPIRRCTGRAGSRGGKCQFAQLGIAMCPCDGTLDEAEYAEVIARLRHGLLEDPTVLLDPIADRMRAYSADCRYEEAGWLRDRHQALARALEARRAWQCLLDAGRIVATQRGDHVAIDAGFFLAGWTGSTPPLLPPVVAGPTPTTPPDALVAEEVRLLWRFLTDPTTEVLDPALPVVGAIEDTQQWIDHVEEYLRAS